VRPLLVLNKTDLAEGDPEELSIYLDLGVPVVRTSCMTGAGLDTLRDMLAAFGDRRVALCREMTKLHEEGLRTTLSEAVARYGAEPARGEFVLVVEGAPPRTAPEATLEEAVALAARLATEGKKPAEAAREAAASSGYKKSEIYRELMNSAKKGETEC
jgi:16S rRNA C1402 (ribose-2'-O) methylase RsmI